MSQGRAGGGSGIRRGIGVLLALMALPVAGLAQPTAEDPLSALELGKSGPGWDGITLGMSLVQAERRFGTTLPLSEQPKARCGRYASASERNGLAIQVGFPAARPGARIETMFVRFEGYQATADAPVLVAALKARIPDAVFLPDSAMSELSEADHPAPSFTVTRGDEVWVVQLRPRDGMLLARRDCVD